MTDEVLLFAYGSLLPGEVHAGHLTAGTHLGPARTVSGYRLVELERFPALIASGIMHIEGELYLVSRDHLRRLDELKENGRLFVRETIKLDSGQEAEAYLMDEEKLRGRRRLRTNDWRHRFAPQVTKVGRRDPFGGWRS